ncbi:MAG TPA: glycosyltransferase [Bacteroidia bacterium]|nr:glycosyltransferase [Bacteroidia bacterium]
MESLNTDLPVTIVYCYRNRDLARVKRSLDSLSGQTNKNFTVIFIDYGSENAFKEEVQKMTSRYSFCKYIYNDTRGMLWNRSHALNSGIRLAETEFVFTADIDMIFKNNFVEKLNQQAKDDCVTFFQVYYLPEKFSNWENISSATYETSKKFALGLALLPVKIIKEIGGYDEFYCFWGLEDNDLEHRLNDSGIKTKFYDQEVLMYHQWHEPSTGSQKDFPTGWGNFQNDYFNSKLSVVKRNDDKEWGKLFSEKQRASIKVMNDSPGEFTVLNGSASYFMYRLMLQFKSINPHETLMFEFNDVNSQTHLQSRLGKTISFLQKIFNAAKIPVKVVSQYRHLYTTVYEVRDELMIFILANNDKIEEYSVFMDERKLKVAIVKK